MVGDIERAVDEDTKGIFDWMKPFLDYMNKAGSKSINMDKSREFSYDCALNGSLFHYVLKILCDIPLPMNPTYYN